LSPRARLIVFLVGIAAFASAMFVAIGGLSRVGAFTSAYGQLLDDVAPTERHSTDVVSAINFDYRAFDTLGEEFIMLASVLGVALLLRESRRQTLTIEQRDAIEHLPGRNRIPTSDAVRVLAFVTVGLDVVFGVDIVVHGQLTPGGGFQGGVVLATAALLAYLGGDAPTLARFAPRRFVEIAEAAGAAAFIAIGLAGLVVGRSFLENVAPLGPQPATILSGGIIPLVSIATGVEVAAGFVLLLLVFLEESLRRSLKESVR
jgi:multicomponent Na+:H+ antiporter subunit B